MSKHSQQKPQIRTVPSETPLYPVRPPATVEAAPEITETGTEPIKTLAGQELKPHRQCPLCWGRRKGYGTSYSTAPNGRTYYKCDKSLTESEPCGHTWSVLIQETSVVVTYRAVDLDGLR